MNEKNREGMGLTLTHFPFTFNSRDLLEGKRNDLVRTNVPSPSMYEDMVRKVFIS